MSPGGVHTRSTLALLLVLTAGCGKAGDGAASADEQPVVGVRTAVAQTQPFTETLGAIGAVTARAGRIAALSAPAAARVARIYVTTGQKVAAGQPLVELEQAPFQAAAQSAEAAFAAAERAYERARRLADEGIVPRKDAEAAAADLAKARADAIAARRSAELAVLRSPLSGIVTRMNAALGASADPSQPLVEVADQSALDILLNVTAEQAGHIRPGASVMLTAGQRAGGEQLGAGSVVDVAGTVDSSTRSVAVRVQAPTTRHPLRIGETVMGQIAVAVHPNAITIPVEALVPEGEGFKVFVVDANGVAHERPIKVGGKTEKVAEITSGLTAGERVVTYGAYGVEDGAKVVPLEQATQ
jgi:RND family efflux transporter MFP subunit